MGNLSFESLASMGRAEVYIPKRDDFFQFNTLTYLIHKFKEIMQKN